MFRVRKRTKHKHKQIRGTILGLGGCQKSVYVLFGVTPYGGAKDIQAQSPENPGQSRENVACVGNCFESRVSEEKTYWVLRRTRWVLWKTRWVRSDTQIIGWEELTELSPWSSVRGKKLTELGVWNRTLRNRTRPVSNCVFFLVCLYGCVFFLVSRWPKSPFWYRDLFLVSRFCSASISSSSWDQPVHAFLGLNIL